MLTNYRKISYLQTLFAVFNLILQKVGTFIVKRPF